MRSNGPARSDPTGAQSPFDRQHMTVVTGSQNSAALTPDATSAFQRRAPSRCVRRPLAASAVIVVTGVTAPDAGMYVFSRHNRLGVGQWCWAAAIAQSTSASDRT